MKYLITGGAGFIGSYLAESLLERGDEVCIVDNLSTGSMANIQHLADYPNIRLVIDSILNEQVMDDIIGSCDMIYHLAAAVGVELIIKKPVEVLETNILGTEIILKLANRHKKKVLITSTSEVYGKNSNVPLREDDDRLLGATTRKRWSYACTKAINEYCALAYSEEHNLDITIVRLFNTIGPRQTGKYGMVVPRFIHQALHNNPITVYGDGKQIRCFTYVTDVVQSIIRVSHHHDTSGQIINIGNSNAISIHYLAKKIRNLVGSNSEITFIPYEKAYEEGFEDMALRIPDLSKIRALIDYEPVMDLDCALKIIIDSFKSRSTPD
jgi:UDP-glucose 4-epimerase